jgi:hypothetical protein
MTLSRALSKQTCRMLIGVLLFAQLAVASHACPSLARQTVMLDGGVPTAMAVAIQAADDANEKSAAMAPGCDQMDPNAGSLCIEHCRFGHQSADTAPSSIVPVASPALLYALPVESELAPGLSLALSAADALPAAPPPPHAILHCVYRI